MRLKQRAAQLTLLPEARLASPPAWQDDGREVLTSDGSGLSFSASAARLLPAGSWQRTLSESLASSLTGSIGCAVSLRLRATKCGRSLLVPTTSAPHTEGTESGSWPTARAGDAKQGPSSTAKHLVTGDLMLSDVVKFWPTAVANDDNKSPEAHMAMKRRMKGGPRSTITSLNVMVKALWPTVHGMDNEGNPRRNGPTGNELGRAVTRQESASPPPLPGETDNQYWERMNRDFPVAHDPNAPQWATPNTMDGGQTSRGGKRRGELLLGGQVRQENWLTSSKQDGEKLHDGEKTIALGRATTSAQRLRNQVHWPTARAEDSESAGAHVARGTAETLTAAARLWPTATSGDGKASGTRTGTPNASSKSCAVQG